MSDVPVAEKPEEKFASKINDNRNYDDDDRVSQWIGHKPHSKIVPRIHEDWFYRVDVGLNLVHVFVFCFDSTFLLQIIISDFGFAGKYRGA
jgi:hypothetical protein